MKKISILFIVVIFTFGLLTGCQNSGGQSEDGNSEATKNSVEESVEENKTDKEKMITITDARGEVKIPANPKKIVDLSGNSDILSILGYSVVGTANSDAYDYTKFPSYLEKTLTGAKILGYSMQDTMDIEGILELEPDLIIISSVQEKMYDQLKEVAPTVMVELAQINWKDDINAFAKIMDKEEKASKWLKEYETKAQEKGKEIKEKYGENTTYLAMLASGGQLYVFDSAGIGSILYEDMGLKKPENMPEQVRIIRHCQYQWSYFYQ